jgi:hypothetical protein
MSWREIIIDPELLKIGAGPIFATFLEVEHFGQSNSNNDTIHASDFCEIMPMKHTH